jgi:CBS domain containing-hemolysin-like protein
MLLLQLLFRTFLYIASTVGIVAIALYTKFVSELIGNEIVYKIPLLGDLLLSIEIIELLNILVFAILGIGFGVASIFLPRTFANRVSFTVLLILVPLIYSTSILFKYHTWVQNFSINENISYEQAEKMTNTFCAIAPRKKPS